MNLEVKWEMAGWGVLACPDLNLTIDVSPVGHKLESSECLLLSHGSVAKVCVRYVKDSLAPLSE